MNQIFALIIEDSFYSADLNLRELKKAGFAAIHVIVANSKAMQKALYEQKWDIILCDNNMPGFNALQALEIRNSISPQVPFVIVSEDISAEDLETALQRNCTAYVLKKNLPELRQMVKELL